MNNSLNPNRLKLARERKALTLKALSELTGITTRMLSNYENGHHKKPSEDTISKLALALSFPKQFFYEDDIEDLDASIVSFRSLSKMKAAEKASAISAGRLAMLFNGWLDNNFTLPKANLLDLRDLSPSAAASAIRQHWGLGELSIRNVIHLLEANGVRVFALAEQNMSVDAFSFWKNDVPFVFLNTMKSAERSRFDAAHELGHLLLHNHGETPTGREAEKEADQFASAFLMPEGSVRSHGRSFPTIEELIQLKKNWTVSVAALTRRLYDLDIISEWHYRSLSVDLGRRGYYKTEPDSVTREQSLLLTKVVSAMNKSGTSTSDVARELSIPRQELDVLLFTAHLATNNSTPNSKPERSPPKLRLVK
ncbi:ImmA/IrrE family metallo-endopeptidase [Pontibacterium granulatum]|uniref:helix-turn-helix domain-containing protein n=1 Tax=Pontibacterium granulatum TaxID=2036029 RepID=UPI002499AE2A|nr:ImmA/IrrE family metallo-endopeptidase [Pontibacterium granulatum]MDI3325594.1 ImmA/IrrE family metallo-endopeptidase [Pontibacterium granulatum]